MTDRLKVYIAGPLTSSGSLAENMVRAFAAVLELAKAGFAPFAPHYTGYIDPTNTLSHDVWMAVDLPWLAAADAVLRLPGESKGADIETREASRLGIPVFSSIPQLTDWKAARELR